jgi:hypothetical protein
VDVEERTLVEMIGFEMVDHQRSKRSPVQRDLGFRRRRGGGGSHVTHNFWLCLRLFSCIVGEINNSFPEKNTPKSKLKPRNLHNCLIK